MARGTIVTRTLKNGQKRYYAALWTEKGDGQRKQIWRTFEKRRRAEAFLDSYSKAVREGDYFEPMKIGFEEFAREWLEKYPRLAEQGPLKPSTINSYNCIIEKHLIPFFGDMQIGQIHSVIIEKDFKAGLPEGLTPKTVRNILVLLQRILNSAVNWGYLGKNPFEGSGKGRVKIPKPSREQKGRALNPEEIHKLFDCCVDDTYAIVATAVLTGIRRGEIFGLRIEDVDFDQSVIHVRQALYYKRGKHWGNTARFVFLPPKYNSIRQIDMSPELRKILLQHWLKIDKQNNQFGLVFTNSKGKPIEPDNFYKRRFLPTVKAADIGHLRLHDLRHTFGSLKIEQGENLKYVQQQMGHSSISVTVDIYGHLLKKKRPEAAAKTDELIFGQKA